MKKVSVRAFQLKPYDYLKELPIMLTRYGEDVAVIETASQMGKPIIPKGPASITSEDIEEAVKDLKTEERVFVMPQSFGVKKK